MDPELQTILAEYDRTRQGELITQLQRVQCEMGHISDKGKRFPFTERSDESNGFQITA